jgi:hypothetical protein
LFDPLAQEEKNSGTTLKEENENLKGICRLSLLARQIGFKFARI